MPETKYVIAGKKIAVQCPNCPAVMSFPLEQAGKNTPCPYCGHPILIPALPEKAKVHVELPSFDQKEKRKFYAMFVAAGCIVAGLGIAAILIGSDGGPVSLAIFSLNFTAGALVLGLFLGPFLFPGRIPDWMTGHSLLFGMHWLYFLLALTAFFFAWWVYSP